MEKAECLLNKVGGAAPAAAVGGPGAGAPRAGGHESGVTHGES